MSIFLDKADNLAITTDLGFLVYIKNKTILTINNCLSFLRFLTLFGAVFCYLFFFLGGGGGRGGRGGDKYVRKSIFDIHHMGR